MKLKDKEKNIADAIIGALSVLNRIDFKANHQHVRFNYYSLNSSSLIDPINIGLIKYKGSGQWVLVYEGNEIYLGIFKGKFINE